MGQLSDATVEDYDFKVALGRHRDDAPKDDTQKGDARKDAAEHVVVVRVFDKYENMGAAKTLLKVK